MSVFSWTSLLGFSFGVHLCLWSKCLQNHTASLSFAFPVWPVKHLMKFISGCYITHISGSRSQSLVSPLKPIFSRHAVYFLFSPPSSRRRVPRRLSPALSSLRRLSDEGWWLVFHTVCCDCGIEALCKFRNLFATSVHFILPEMSKRSERIFLV